MRCTLDRMNIGKLFITRSAIDMEPEYQRESAIWSREKMQLFIDSLLNAFDVPKVYFHDLTADRSSNHEFAVVDGKQRLHTVFSFMSGEYPLADDFTLDSPQRGMSAPPPRGPVTFQEFHDDWKEYFRSLSLDVVRIDDADTEDIEELFSRLNNGEPLNAAEKRNAIGGRMCALIREVATHAFFTERVRVSNRRYAHREMAAKLILIEHAEMNGGAMWVDVKKKYLDAMVERNKELPDAVYDGLKSRVDKELRQLTRIFDKHDPHLSKQAYGPLYYLFVKYVVQHYAHANLYSIVRGFLDDFAQQRQANLSKPDEERDSALIEFGRLMQQGTNDRTSLQERVEILTRYLLQSHPDIQVKDPKRAFTPVERHVIWLRSGKQCENESCRRELKSIEDMEADHTEQWAMGGPTTLDNARALCTDCNQRLKVSVG